MQIYKDGPALSKLAEQFKQIPFLQSFEGDLLKQILTASRMIVYGPDELILPEGAFGDHLYVLLRGKVRVVKNKSSIAVLDQVGEIFGELAALGNETRTASIFAVETSWCLELNLSVLQKLPAGDRDACHAILYRFVARIVADRLKKTTDELALVARELEVTRRKLAELRQNPGRGALDDELGLAIEQLRRAKEKLSQLGRSAEEPASA